MADTNNPWSADGWNVTAQMAYLRQNGQARADARARDAGTTVGGRRPKSAGAVQSGDGGGTTKYIILKKFFQIPNAPSVFFSVAEIHPAIGVSMAAFVTRELILPPAAPAIGFNSAAVVTLEKDIAVSPAGMGFNVAAVVDRFFQPTVNNAVGVSMAAAIQRSTNPTVQPGLGITEAVVLTTFVSGLPAASAVLGISQATTITFEKDLAAAPALGVAQATTLTRELDFAAAPALGIAQAVTIQLSNNFVAAPALGISQAVIITREADFSSVNALGYAVAVQLDATAPTRNNPTFVNNGTPINVTVSSASQTPALPASRVSGNLLLAYASNNVVGEVFTTTTTGWTRIYQSNATNRSCAVFARFVDGTEAAPVINLGTSSNTGAYVVAQYGNVKSVTAWGATGGADGSGNPRTAPAVTTTDVNSTLVLAGWPAGAATTFGSPTGYTQDLNDNGANSNAGLTLFHQNMATSGSSSTAWSSGGTGGATWIDAIIELIAS